MKIKFLASQVANEIPRMPLLLVLAVGVALGVAAAAIGVAAIDLSRHQGISANVAGSVE